MAQKNILVDLDIAGDITADSFIKDGGSSSQFLKADGSVDTTTYSTFDGAYGSLTGAPDLSDYIEADAAGDVNIGTTSNFYQLNLGDSGEGKSLYATGKVFADCFQSVTTAKIGSDLVMGNTTSGNMIRENLTGFTSVSGGDDTTTGGALILYGENNASYPDNIVLRNSSGEAMRMDSSKNTEFYGDVGLDEDKKMIFDKNGDSFANIFSDQTNASVMTYNSINGHHFKNGDDDAFDFVKAGSFIADGGTSSDFLKADGSLDSNTYLTSSSTQSKYLRSDQADTTTGTLTAPKFFVSATSGASQWAFQARNNSSTADSGLYFNGNSSELYLRKSDNNIGARIRSNGDSYFKGGKLGIGMDATERLHISGETHPSIKVQSSSDANYNFEQKVNYGNEAYQLIVGGYNVMTTEGYNTPEKTFIWANNSKALSFESTGAATFSNTVTGTNFILSSDSRLKENVEEVDNKSINVDWKTFEMKNDEGQKRYGVIAQELEEVHPEFVRTDDEGMKSVAYVDLLIAKIAELEARLEKLEK